MIGYKIAGAASSFTIKHISISGEENLYVGTNVCFKPAQQTTELRDSISRLRFTTTSGETELVGGTIFVMNDQGRTVARYDIGASPVPLDGIREEKVRAA